MRVAEDFEVPARSCDERRSQGRRRGDDGARGPTPLNVLYAEDNLGDVRLVEILVAQEGEHLIELQSADRLQSALAILEKGEVDILLLDLTLPDSSGIDTVSRVVRAAPEVPIVVLTGFKDRDLGIRALRAGALDFLSKSGLNGELLVRTLKLAAERAQLERKLRESERRYALAAEGSNDGLWDWDLRTNRVYYSARWKELLRCGNDEVCGTPEEWFSRVHSDDLAALQTSVEALRTGRAQNIESEHRVRMGDGSWRWMLCRAAAARDLQGNCLRMAGSMTDITHRKTTEEELRRGAFHDSLTGLSNRAVFLDRLQRCILRSRRRPDVGYAVLFLDLDRFKRVNDSVGHHAGDLLLIEVARRLEACMRPGDTVARLGGDEFALLVDEVRHEHHAFHVAERILAALAAPVTIERQEVTACASIGIALGPAKYEKPGQVLRDADIALHQAKKSGKGRYEVFEPRMHAEAVHLARLEADLRRALEQQQFRLCYQPIVSLKTGSITSFEALLRWQHPLLGCLLPDSFLPIAEETGVICGIGSWVLGQACRTTARWQRDLPSDPPIGVHVNLSAREFRSPGLERIVGTTLAESALEPSSLRLEITEGTAMDDMEDRPLLRRLRAQGVRLAIDDFGTGYSSLAALHLIPVQCLKIDKTFVQRLGPTGENGEVVQAIIAMANSLGLETIAEGVETKSQLAVLRQLGCGYGQGYHFSRPVPAEDAHRLLLRERNGTQSPSE
jgi:diguanylate cyclase (GGDEF)-like protein/PAS domain S-box-containing protein